MAFRKLSDFTSYQVAPIHSLFTYDEIRAIVSLPIYLSRRGKKLHGGIYLATYHKTANIFSLDFFGTFRSGADYPNSLGKSVNGEHLAFQAIKDYAHLYGFSPAFVAHLTSRGLASQPLNPSKELTESINRNGLRLAKFNFHGVDYNFTTIETDEVVIMFACSSDSEVGFTTELRSTLHFLLEKLFAHPGDKVFYRSFGSREAYDLFFDYWRNSSHCKNLRATQEHFPRTNLGAVRF